MSPVKSIEIVADLENREDLRERIEALDLLIRTELDLPEGDVRWRVDTGRFGREVLVLSVEWRHDNEKGEAEIDLDPSALMDEAIVRSKLRDLRASASYVKHWRDSLEQLYSQVEQWLMRYSRQSNVFKSTTVNMYEERGRYEAPSRTIKVGQEEVYLGPVAMWVVGADGQVDMCGPSDRHDLLLRGEKWYYAPRFPGEEDQQLTEGLFHKLLDQVLE
jgi:hypothetical protein